jgi:hypothetical protein
MLTLTLSTLGQFPDFPGFFPGSPPTLSDRLRTLQKLQTEFFKRPGKTVFTTGSESPPGGVEGYIAKDGSPVVTGEFAQTLAKLWQLAGIAPRIPRALTAAEAQLPEAKLTDARTKIVGALTDTSTLLKDLAVVIPALQKQIDAGDVGTRLPDKAPTVSVSDRQPAPTTPFFKKPLFWVVVGGAVVAGGTVFALTRRRKA